MVSFCSDIANVSNHAANARTTKREMTDRPTIYVAGCVQDAQFVRFCPGSLAVAGGVILGVGEPAEVIRQHGSNARIVELPHGLLIPALVNAHAHLDLTSIGPRRYPGSFIQWVREVIAHRRQLADGPGQSDTPVEAIDAGVRASLRHGVGRIGDVLSWNPAALEHIQRSRLGGWAFVELIGLVGPRLDAAVRLASELSERRSEARGMRAGLQPHAPYSTGPQVYRAAVSAHRSAGLALSTHLAETPEEVEFVGSGTGPLRRLLEELGTTDDRWAEHYRDGLSPVQWLDQQAGEAPWLCAHCNYVNDADIAIMAHRRWSVAYCPRASDYFGHRAHRYRDMLEAKVNVCLGTDSVICHGDLSVLNEMRHLLHRDHTEAGVLLKMATINGMIALGLDPAEATFSVGARPGVVALSYDPSQKSDALQQVLGGRYGPSIQVLEPAG